MKTLSSIAAVVLLAGCCLGMSAGRAAEAPLTDATASVAAQHLKQDATCTRCHDESEARPVLSIYQTRHGNSADPDSPTCISCHGASAQHINGGKGKGGATRPAPDIVFKKTGSDSTVSSAVLQEQTCLGCHREGQRTHWEGSQHESQGVPCSSCHSVHVKADPVLAKATQAEVCFACHNAHFSPSWTAFQADRGRCFSGIVDGISV